MKLLSLKCRYGGQNLHPSNISVIFCLGLPLESCNYLAWLCLHPPGDEVDQKFGMRWEGWIKSVRGGGKNILNKELWENIPLLTHFSGKLHDLKIWEDTFRNFTGYPNFLKVYNCHQKVTFVFFSPRMIKISKPKLNKISTSYYYYLKSTIISTTESSEFKL